MSSEPASDDRPWTEEQWEKLLNESDVRSAKFGELFETLIDHPDRDAIIEHEMGWDRDEPQPGDAERVEEMNEMMRQAVDNTEIAEEIQRSHDDLEELPAYARAYEFGLHVHNELKTYLIPDQEDQDEDLIAALGNGFTIAAKLAGAHGMGYEDDLLCGNIAVCNRGQTAAEECLLGLQSACDRGVVPATVIEPLIREAEEVLALVKDHIAQLRSRVWWQ